MHPTHPFMDGPWKLAMGLHALDPADWLVRDAAALAQIPERRALLRDHRDMVVQSVPRSLAAQGEVRRLVVDHLRRHGGGAPPVDEDGAAPLAAAAGLVAEDLCVLEGAADGYRLTAGVVCFPLHWSLAEKLDRPLRDIHAPVPGLDDRLSTAMDRFFARLTPERPVWRVNWSLVDTPELFLPPAHRGDARRFDPARPDLTLWFRSERQTLRRLPETGAVLFTILTRIAPLGAVLDRPGAAAALAARLREMPEAMARYKGMLPIRDALLAWLDRVATRRMSALFT